MKKLEWKDGLETYDLMGRYQIQLNPTDINTVEKLYSAFADLDGKQAAWEKERQGLQGTAIFDYSKKRDAEMRRAIDGALGEGLSDAVFGEMNVYALADGFPVWANLLFAIIDEMDAQAVQAVKATSPRVEYYNKKYGKKK